MMDLGIQYLGRWS